MIFCSCLTFLYRMPTCSTCVASSFHFGHIWITYLHASEEQQYYASKTFRHSGFTCYLGIYLSPRWAISCDKRPVERDVLVGQNVPPILTTEPSDTGNTAPSAPSPIGVTGIGRTLPLIHDGMTSVSVLERRAYVRQKSIACMPRSFNEFVNHLRTKVDRFLRQPATTTNHFRDGSCS
jgi:hypothetical protein